MQGPRAADIILLRETDMMAMLTIVFNDMKGMAEVISAVGTFIIWMAGFAMQVALFRRQNRTDDAIARLNEANHKVIRLARNGREDDCDSGEKG